MDMGQTSQTTGGLSASDFVSPSKGTRTRTIREYEQTISELKKENFDLKLRVYLLEEGKNKGSCCSSPSAKDNNTVQVMVQLQMETESLHNELQYKDKLLTEAVERSEKYVADLRKMEEKSVDLQSLLSQLPSQEEFVCLFNDKKTLLKQKEGLEKSLAEKTDELNMTNQRIEMISKYCCSLEEKLKKRNRAIEGFVYKSYQEKEELPDALRSVVVTASQAAKSGDKKALAVVTKSISAVLDQILCSSVSTESEKEESSQAKCLVNRVSEEQTSVALTESAPCSDPSPIQVREEPLNDTCF